MLRAIVHCIVGSVTCASAFTQVACGDGREASAQTAVPPAQAKPADVMDSVLPVEEEMRRFDATLKEEPAGLGDGAATSRDALVRAFITALGASDTATLVGLSITRAEFGYLYYPHTRYTREPYRLSPAALWFLNVQNGEKGIRRALRELGGQSIGLQASTCDAEPDREGPNLIWHGCYVDLRMPDGTQARRRLFGSILEREGRFKFITYANDL